MPIHNSNGEILGVVQLLNKMDNTPFNANDENLFQVGSVQIMNLVTHACNANIYLIFGEEFNSIFQ